MNKETEYNKQHGIISAKWCIDSETGVAYLIDLVSGDIVAKRVDGKIADPNESKS